MDEPEVAEDPYEVRETWARDGTNIGNLWKDYGNIIE